MALVALFLTFWQPLKKIYWNCSESGALSSKLEVVGPLEPDDLSKPIAYGQRFAVSSQPAARACCGVAAVAKVGLPSAASLSSDNSGAATRNASTSFSNLANSSSFCLKTS